MAKLKSFIQFVNESNSGLLHEATFNIKDAKQVADLLAKIASKRAGGRLQTFNNVTRFRH
jgi:hypothetical protein